MPAGGGSEAAGAAAEAGEADSGRQPRRGSLPAERPPAAAQPQPSPHAAAAGCGPPGPDHLSAGQSIHAALD